MRGSVASSPWRWVPSLYFAQGLPYAAVTGLSVIVYKDLGISNLEIALYTSWLYMPWVLKPLWAPLAELFGTRRGWVVCLQFCIAVAFALVAFSLPAQHGFQFSLALLWLIAFASASHDIAADGLYLLGLQPHTQAAFVGVRSAFWRLADIAAQGGVVALAGWWQLQGLGTTASWSRTFMLLAAVFGLLALLHLRALPRLEADRPLQPQSAARAQRFLEVFTSFFKRPDLAAVLAFLLLYRFPEAQLLKLIAPFLIDPRDRGGLGLSVASAGVIYGTVGLFALTVGGLCGGWVIARIGLRRAMWPLALTMHTPNALLLLLASTRPDNLLLTGLAVALQQLGYGLGFTCYLVLMFQVAEGPHRTTHNAICTGFMALGMMVPGLWSGWLQEQLGYVSFFAWVLAATVPSLAATAWVRAQPTSDPPAHQTSSTRR